jgi:hypothetical protein
VDHDAAHARVALLLIPRARARFGGVAATKATRGEVVDGGGAGFDGSAAGAGVEDGSVLRCVVHRGDEASPVDDGAQLASSAQSATTTEMSSSQACA